MAFSVNTNTSALTALRTLTETTRALEVTQNRINTGLIVSSAKDNAGTFAIAQNMRADLRGLNAIGTSLNRADSVLNVALNAAETISDLLIEAQGIAVAATDPSLDADSYQALNNDFQAILTQINSVSRQATFNGTNIITDNPDDIVAVVGINEDGSIQTINLTGADLTSDSLLATGNFTASVDFSDLTSLGQNVLSSLATLDGIDTSLPDSLIVLDSLGNLKLNLNSSAVTINDNGTGALLVDDFYEFTLNGATFTSLVGTAAPSLTIDFGAQGATFDLTALTQDELGALARDPGTTAGVIVQDLTGVYSFDLSGITLTDEDGDTNADDVTFKLAGVDIDVLDLDDSGVFEPAEFAAATVDAASAIFGPITMPPAPGSSTLGAGVFSTADKNISVSVTLINESLSDIDLTTLESRQIAVLAVRAFLNQVNNVLAAFGSTAKQIELQADFSLKLSDNIEEGIGNLVDADLARESARLTALQVKQQLGLQALSIANRAPQSILELFR